METTESCDTEASMHTCEEALGRLSTTLPGFCNSSSVRHACTIDEVGSVGGAIEARIGIAYTVPAEIYHIQKKISLIIWHIVLMYSPVIERSRTKLSMNIPVAFSNPCTATGVKYRSSRLAFVPFFRGLDAAYLLSLGEVRCPHAICGSPPLLCQLLLIQYLP